MADRKPEPRSFWVDGVNSLLHPCDITPRQYGWAVNIIARGGVVQNRPGYRYVGKIDGTNPQGFTIFARKGGLPIFVAAVDGRIYTAQWPEFDFKLLAGPIFDASVDQIIFQTCVKSVKRNTIDGTIKAVTSYNVLIMQDGVNPAWYWDGVTSAELDPARPKLETPSGKWMTWSGARLWVSNGQRVLASDLGDPLSFAENIYVAERSNFEMPGEVTGMIETASRNGLLVFTATTTTAIKSTILTRTQWQQTPDFQELILPGIGCLAGKSAINQYGSTWWMSDKGFISLDAALSSLRSSRIVTIDGEMMRSKRTLDGDLSRSCSAQYENILMLSVPSGSRYNEHTWVMDQATIDNGSQQPGRWNGIWTGIRPVEVRTYRIASRDRCFALCNDSVSKDDSSIHLWELFQDNREDGTKSELGLPVKCLWETGIISSTDLIRFKFIEIEAVEIMGDVQLDIYIGGTKGPWIKITDEKIKIQAEKGSLKRDVKIDLGTIIKSFKPQSRTLTTPEFTNQDQMDSPEYGDGKRGAAGYDKGFAFLFVWQGRMGIREIRPFFEAASEGPTRGACMPDESDMHNAVDGAGNTVPA